VIQFAAQLNATLPLVADPVVTGMEVSLDAYRSGASRAELADAGAHMYKFNTGPCEKARVQGDAGTRGQTNAFVHYRDMRDRLEDGRVLFVGDVDRPGAARCYVKTRDAGRDLAPDHWRARLEHIMCAADVPHRDIAGWRGFRFETLQKQRFTFRRLKDGLDKWSAFSASNSAQVGQKKARTRLDGSTRVFSRYTEADTELNSKVREALRSLTRRWASGPVKEVDQNGLQPEKMGERVALADVAKNPLPTASASRYPAGSNNSRQQCMLGEGLQRRDVPVTGLDQINTTSGRDAKWRYGTNVPRRISSISRTRFGPAARRVRVAADRHVRSIGEHDTADIRGPGRVQWQQGWQQCMAGAYRGILIAVALGNVLLP
jgi:hypothetical protein